MKKSYRITYKMAGVEYVTIVELDAKSPEEAHRKFMKLPSPVEREAVLKVEELR